MQIIERVSVSPVILQQYVEKATELRVTFFGDIAFCCNLDSQSSKDSATDWRAVEPTEIPHAIMEFDEGLKSKCLKMLSYYGLSFGTFDFVQPPTGEAIFLELNPNGQWYWIEMLTGAKMAAAMAELLIKKHTAELSRI